MIILFNDFVLYNINYCGTCQRPLDVFNRYREAVAESAACTDNIATELMRFVYSANE